MSATSSKPIGAQRTQPLAGALFDLDGTLLDTAPDMCRITNQLRAEAGLSPMSLAQVRPLVSHGSPAVLRAAFTSASASEFTALRARFLDLYSARLVVDTCLFAGFDAVLDQLDAHRIPWGVVTNKPRRLTEPLLQQLGLFERAGAVLSGDSLAVAKPDPLPLLTAAERLGIDPAQCLYLGDALRDAQAAQAAGMLAVGAGFGYIGPDDDIHNWPVAGWISEPAELLDWIGLPRQ